MLIGKAKGSISYAGDQLDVLAWRNKNVLKKYDGDGDNVLGTAGYCIFGNKITSTYAAVPDTGNHLPAFITDLKPQHVVTQSGAYLPVPGRIDVLNHTGLIEVTGDVAVNGLVSFTLGKNPPPSFRLGVMLDNADKFTKVGKYLWVTDSRNGNSGKVLLANSNRVPDWYFFDIKGLKEGDIVTVQGSTEKSNDIFTIGALTFDLNK